MDSLPFTNTNAYEGLAETEGVIRLEGDHLHLEFQTRDALLGVVKSELQEIQIPVADLAGAEFQKGLLRTYVLLRARRLQAFADVPGAKGAELRLRVARRLREEAEQFALAVQLRISEHGLRRMDENLRGA